MILSEVVTHCLKEDFKQISPTFLFYYNRFESDIRSLIRIVIVFVLSLKV